MIKGIKSGNNTTTGLKIEGKTKLETFLAEQPGYEVKDGAVLYNGTQVARIFKKHKFYSFLQELGIDWSKIISKKLLPDDSIFVSINNTLFVIESKLQKDKSLDSWRLQTCDFKKKQYQKLMSQANIEVEYIYLLNEWFKAPKYKDMLDYILSVDCQYYFEHIPLTKLGLPVSLTKQNI